MSEPAALRSRWARPLLWVMVLFARLFGFSFFSLLVPQALMGVGTVALTYGAVKRWSAHAAGRRAGGGGPGGGSTSSASAITA